MIDQLLTRQIPAAGWPIDSKSSTAHTLCRGRRRKQGTRKVVSNSLKLLAKIGWILALSGAVTACGWVMPAPQTRGNKVAEDQLKELVPGVSTKADVTALIGSPTQKATFDENTWLYITEVTRPRIGRTLGVIDQGVVVLSFDDRGILTSEKTVTDQDAVPVAVASRTTPSPGTEASFMQQLLGNIGKFNAGGATPSPGGGAPALGGGL
jgi:outer membrane protein assembly factor BamE (lipoprotein component of BamABCDE complex)